MRQPSINALRAFEAAARHSSFKRAGEELHVSPGAVSRFVRMLEEDLGVKLFERLPNGLRLTEKGMALCPRLTQAFRDIESAVGQVSQASDEIRIVLPETLGLRLLIQKIGEFNEAGLGPKVRYSVEFKGWESFFSSDFDLGVCCYVGSEQRPAEFEFRLLRSEALTPLCSPRLLAGARALRNLEDLANFDLLHPYTDKTDWKKWLSAAGVRNVDPESGLTFLSMELAVKAALQGFGVVIGDLTLIEEEIRRGDLVAPFDFVLTDDTGYFIFGRVERLNEPRISAFCDWLIREVGSEAMPSNPSPAPTPTT